MARVYNIEQAAAELAPVFTAGWLRGHIDEIPHIRAGEGNGKAGRIGFTDAHLAQILAKYEVRPPAPEPEAEFKSIRTRRRAS